MIAVVDVELKGRMLRSYTCDPNPLERGVKCWGFSSPCSP